MLSPNDSLIRNTNESQQTAIIDSQILNSTFIPYFVRKMSRQMMENILTKLNARDVLFIASSFQIDLSTNKKRRKRVLVPQLVLMFSITSFEEELRLSISSLFNTVQFRLIGGDFKQLIIYQLHTVLETIQKEVLNSFITTFEVDMKFVQNLVSDGYSILFLMLPDHSNSIIDGTSEYCYPNHLYLKLNSTSIQISNLGTAIPIEALQERTTIECSFNKYDLRFQKGFILSIRMVKKSTCNSEKSLTQSGTDPIGSGIQPDSKLFNDWSESDIHPVNLLTDDQIDAVYKEYGTTTIHYSEYFEILDQFKIKTSKQITSEHGWYNTDERCKSVNRIEAAAIWQLMDRLKERAKKLKDDILNEDLEEFHPSKAMQIAMNKPSSATNFSVTIISNPTPSNSDKNKYYDVPRTEKEKVLWRARNAKKIKQLKKHDRLEHVWRYTLNAHGAYFHPWKRNLYYPGSNEPIPLDPFDGTPLYTRSYAERV